MQKVSPRYIFGNKEFNGNLKFSDKTLQLIKHNLTSY